MPTFHIYHLFALFSFNEIIDVLLYILLTPIIYGGKRLLIDFMLIKDT